MPTEGLLPPDSLARYADAIVKASLAVGPGDTFVVQGEPEHRELLAAVAESAYRAGAKYVDVMTADPLVARASLLYGSDDAIGALAPWTRRLLREASAPQGASAYITGAGEAGYLDGVPPERIATGYQRLAKQVAFVRRLQLEHGGALVDRRVAGQPLGEPGLPEPRDRPREAEAREGSPQLLPAHRRRRRRNERLDEAPEDPDTPLCEAHEARSDRPRAARPGTALDVGLAPGTRWLGGPETMKDGRVIAPNMPTEEVFTSPEAGATSGTFRCTFPLSFRGRLIEGLRGEFAGGRLVRLEADSETDRDFVAAYIDSDKGGRRLGEVALVDASSRIGQARRIYYNTLLDENAAAHIAFGSGFGGTRNDSSKRGINQSTTHLDVMIGSPKLEVTGIGARGRRIPLIRDGLWQI